MNALSVYVEGLGVWSSTLADIDALRARRAGAPPATPVERPPASRLSAGERRRASASVLLAVEVAGQAVAMSGRAADTLACVFASAYGDLAITDYLCATLARTPDELSPTRFHHSVHNAPAGYWTIATDCHAPSSAICAGHATAGAGLLEAATLACAGQQPVLLVCSDIAGHGPLGEVVACHHDFGGGLVLSPILGPGSRARLALTLARTSCTPSSPPIDCTSGMSDNPSAALLPLLESLLDATGHVTLAAARGLALHARVEPMA
ncbi:beta-ketoacyl synthase chain length factor [Rhodanobacter glycinis]|uniref:Beta-ketoacyl synthase, N-terminal domain n=1 Tax=Rhodanobacter glycinis TaxID=582702 RepID=A0A1I4B2X2_9GAMM|nr:beta-ketoacyl synthase chain length factor [Rhodanobacter glycinis]SFK62527.1 Beta-ketoacyl synthase, N-terminal domain [Rhodanobacter glycinis]